MAAVMIARLSLFLLIVGENSGISGRFHNHKSDPGNAVERQVRTHEVRKERAAKFVSKVAKFAIEELASFGLGSLLDEITDNDEFDVIIEKLDGIIGSLSEIQGKLEEIKAFMQELKNRQTIINALTVERKLRVLLESYQTLAKAIRAYDPNNTDATQQQKLLQKDIEEITSALKIIPGLLTEFHLVITGESTVAAGRFAGLACEFIESCIADLRTASAEDYDVMRKVTKISTYQNSLMSLQTASFQLYNTTCAEHDLTCQQNQQKLENLFNEQDQRFKNCTPFLFQHMNSTGYNGYIKIIHDTTHQVLYTKQVASIVRDGMVDLERIETPQDAGIRCPVKNSPDESWSLINAHTNGHAGYFIKQKRFCYLSYDQKFIAFEEKVPLTWTDKDHIDRYEFLICQPTLSSSAVKFLLSADEASENSSYTLRTEHKFLNVHAETTSLYLKIDRRLVLVLFLDDKKSNSWKILPEAFDFKCDNSTTLEVADGDDDAIGRLIGGVLTAVVVIPALIAILCVCKRKGLLDIPSCANFRCRLCFKCDRY